MFCPTCGTEQLQGTTFCSNCGAELSNIKVVSPPPKSLNNIEENSIPNNFTNEQQGINLRKIPNDPFNGNIQKQIPNMPTMPSIPTLPNIGMPQVRYPNQMVNSNMQNMGMPNHNQMPVMQNMGMPIQYPNQMPNMQNTGMPMQHPNQMVNPNMQNMGIPNHNQMPIMQNMGMPMQYPNQMPNMQNTGMPMQQQININIMDKPTKKKKNKFLAAALAFCFGTLGAHKFYLGKYGWGVLYALFPFFSLIFALATDSEAIFMLSFLPYCISIAESIMYLCMSNEDFQKKY